MLKTEGLSRLLAVPRVHLELLVPSEHEEVATWRPLRLTDLLIVSVLVHVFSGLGSSLDIHFYSHRAITGKIEHLDKVLIVSYEEEVAIGTEVDTDRFIASVYSLGHLKAGKVKDSNFTVPSVGHESAVRGEV